MAPRFFADETDLGLGKALALAHDGVVHPGHFELPEVPRGTVDDEWLPVVGQQRLVVITRDQKIRRRPVEKRAWVTHGVRGFVLTGRTSQSTTDSLVILERHWQRIEALVDAEPDGPWMRAVTMSGIRSINL